MYFHASSIKGIEILEPRISNHGVPLIYFSTKRENVLVYLSNAVEKYCKETGFHYSGEWTKWGPYGFNKDGTQRIEEYYPNALKDTYKGVSGYIYAAQEITVSDFQFTILRYEDRSKAQLEWNERTIQEEYERTLNQPEYRHFIEGKFLFVRR